MLHAVVHLMVKKGIFSPVEYDDAHLWFQTKFKELARLSASVAYKEGEQWAPPLALTELISSIQMKLFGGT